MFDHVVFSVSDYEAAKAFFLKALEPLGVALVSEGPLGVEMARPGHPASLCLRRTVQATTHLHLAFTADSRDQVDRFHRAALAAGGRDHGAPGVRPQYHPHYYAAFVIGPDGHNIEAVCHAPPAVSDAEPGDADEIRRLMATVIERDVTRDPALLADTVGNVNANVDLWLREPARCVHLVARQGPRIVGVVLVKDFWNLCSLFVASDVQGQGLGRQLVQAAAARCRGLHEENALLLNAATAAVPFYRRLGFTERTTTRTLPPGFIAMRLPL